MNHDKTSSVPSRHITEHHMNHHETSQLNYYKQCEHMWGKNGLGMDVCICVWEYESGPMGEMVYGMGVCKYCGPWVKGVGGGCLCLGNG